MGWSISFVAIAPVVAFSSVAHPTGGGCQNSRPDPNPTNPPCMMDKNIDSDINIPYISLQNG